MIDSCTIPLLCCCVPATDAASSSSTPDLSSATESAKSAASDIKSKAKSTLKGNSALPNDMGTVADGPAFRGLKESFKPESEKDPNAGEWMSVGAAPAWCFCCWPSKPRRG